MKIKSLHIAAFGGIKNLDLDLQQNFSIIYGDNENGKTTIMNFIKMMFYGSERSGNQLNKNIRKKYTPWDGSAMAGSVDFENEGRNYRLERIFASSNSTDKVTLIDLSLGERQAAASDIGAKLFGLTCAAFERSIFIGQFGFPDSNALAEGELQSKLSNIALTGDEAISFEAVQKRLQTARYELSSKSGKAGAYDKNVKLSAELKNQLEQANKDLQTLQLAKQRATQITEIIKDLQQKSDVLKQQIDAENDVRNAQKLRDLLELKAQLDDLNNSITLSDGKIADEMFLRKIEFCLSKIENIESKIGAKQNETEVLENNLKLALSPTSDATPEKVEELKQKIDTLQNEKDATTKEIAALEQAEKPKSGYILWYVLTVVFGIAAVALLSVSKIITIVCGTLAAVCLILAVVLTTKTKNTLKSTESRLVKLRLEETRLISLLASETSNLNAVNTALGSNSAMIENQKDIINQNKADIATFNAEKDTEIQTLFTLFSSYKQADSVRDIKSAIEDIRSIANEQKELKQNINYILKDVGNISYQEAEEKLKNLNIAQNIDFEQIKTEYDTVTQQIVDRKTQLATLTTELKNLTSSADNVEKINAQLCVLQTTISSQKEYLDGIDLALEVLADSYAEVRQSYSSVLEQKASRIFAGITDNKYKNMSISKAFDIAVEKTDIFGSHELDYLSSGTVDQAYLSLRLALSELIEDSNRKLPVILDDALAQYDDTRAKTALEFLKNYSTDGQVIIFTCHKSLLDMAQSLGAEGVVL